MNILQTLIKLRDDIKAWVTKNLISINTTLHETTSYVHDELDTFSTEIDNLAERIGDTPVRDQIIDAIAAQPRFSGDYNDLTNAPDIKETSEDQLVLADKSGNIIFKADAQGLHTTDITLNGQPIEEVMEAKVAAVVDSAPDALQTLNNLAQALGEDPNFAATVTAELGKKVDKVAGKGLSTNDFTDEYKNKIDNPELMEQDPTVPAWAKQPVKPSYTAAEVGLSNVDNTADLDKPVSTATQEALDTAISEISENIVSDSDEFSITDEAGNIVFAVGEEGTNVNNLWVAGQSLSEVIDDSIASLKENIDSNTNSFSIVDANGNIAATISAYGFETTQVVTQKLLVNGQEVDGSSGSGGELPPVTAADNGKVYQVVNGTWQLVKPITYLA